MFKVFKNREEISLVNFRGVLEGILSDHHTCHHSQAIKSWEGFAYSMIVLILLTQLKFYG